MILGLEFFIFNRVSGDFFLKLKILPLDFFFVFTRNQKVLLKNTTIELSIQLGGLFSPYIYILLYFILIIYILYSCYILYNYVLISIYM